MADQNERPPALPTDDPSQRLNFEFIEDAAKKCVTAKLTGRVDVFTYLELSKRLNEQFENRPGLALIVDMSGVSFVASSGWSVMIATRTRLRRVDGRLAFAGMNEDLHRIYESMKLPELIPAFASAAEAEKALTSA